MRGCGWDERLLDAIEVFFDDMFPRWRIRSFVYVDFPVLSAHIS